MESGVTGYQIYKNTGISQTVISTLRNGNRGDIDNLTLKAIEKLYEYAKAHLN
ncbi:hypothetical protein [Staphylococcus equorum]|uniref:hypothetical protein n=1 Tax=Staphylococcus equorum TaxID=246432 RepID=UPI001E61A463|nr:hypothetical protein [Staphylococcus equorum]